MDRKFAKRLDRRHLIAAGAVLAILVLAWAGGWFWLASWAGRKATATLDELAQRGVDIECRERRIVGFPFALRLACAETRVADRSTDSSASLAGLTGGASIFAPMTMRVSMTAPVQAGSPGFGTADLSWDSAEVSAGIGMNGPRNIAFQAERLEADLAVPKLPVHKFAARSAEGSLGLSANGGSDVAVTFADLGVSLQGVNLPTVSGNAKAELSVPPHALLGGRAAMQAPVWARGIEVALDSAGAKLRVAGDLSVDVEGIVDGRMTLIVGGAEALPAVIASLPAKWQKVGNAVAGGLFAFGKATKLDGKPASELTVEIDRSEATIGPIEFTIPKVPM